MIKLLSTAYLSVLMTEIHPQKKRDMDFVSKLVSEDKERLKYNVRIQGVNDSYNLMLNVN